MLGKKEWFGTVSWRMIPFILFETINIFVTWDLEEKFFKILLVVMLMYSGKSLPTQVVDELQKQ